MADGPKTQAKTGNMGVAQHSRARFESLIFICQGTNIVAMKSKNHASRMGKAANFGEQQKPRKKDSKIVRDPSEIRSFGKRGAAGDHLFLGLLHSWLLRLGRKKNATNHGLRNPYAAAQKPSTWSHDPLIKNRSMTPFR